MRDISESGAVGISGLGYMGLATALAFAHHGRTVVAFDARPELRASLAAARTPIYEAGLTRLLRSELASARFRVVGSWEELAGAARTIFLCLPTPRRPSGRIDLRPLGAGVRQLADALPRGGDRRLVVIKSTVVPGTTEGFVRPLLERRTGRTRADLGVAANPEFLAEGSMVRDALTPDRIVIGTSEPLDRDWLREAYRGFRAPIVCLTPTGAELVKYSANAFLALKVSFANEISRLAEPLGVDIDDVMRGVGLDPRIGPRFLSAGPGFGGSCFAKDVQALVARAGELGAKPTVLRSLSRANELQTHHAFELVRRAAGDLSDARVALLGLAFKDGTDDVRESRALPLLRALTSAGAKVRGHDPVALVNFERASRAGPAFPRGSVRFVPTVEEALDHADVAIVQAAWPEYRRWPRRWSERMRRPVVVDLRRCLSPSLRRRGDFLWFGLGVGSPVREVGRGGGRKVVNGGLRGRGYRARPSGGARP